MGARDGDDGGKYAEELLADAAGQKDSLISQTATAVAAVATRVSAISQTLLLTAESCLQALFPP